VPLALAWMKRATGSGAFTSIYNKRADFHLRVAEERERKSVAEERERKKKREEKERKRREGKKEKKKEERDWKRREERGREKKKKRTSASTRLVLQLKVKFIYVNNWY
jgi:hypothetical protein